MTENDECLGNAVRVVMPWLRTGSLLQRSWHGKWPGEEISTSLTETLPQSIFSVWYALKTEKHGVALKRENGGSQA